MDYQNSLILESELIARLERRREWRESLRVPVEVSGFDSRGRFFTERTSTLDVSDSGCCFSLNAEVEKNSAVSVRVVRRRNGLMLDDPAVLFRVVWVRQIQPGWPKWTVAGVKMQPVRLASVGFPAETVDARAASSVPLDETPTA